MVNALYSIFTAQSPKKETRNARRIHRRTYCALVYRMFPEERQNYNTCSRGDSVQKSLYIPYLCQFLFNFEICIYKHKTVLMLTLLVYEIAVYMQKRNT